MEKKLRLVSSVISSSVLAVVFVTVITISGETYAPLKNWLASTFTHHWLGKSVLTAGVFVIVTIILTIIPYRETSTSFSLGRRIQRLNLVTVVATAALVGFFIYHYYFV